MRKTGWIAIVLLSASSILLPAVTQSTFCAEQPGKPTPVRISIVSRSTLDMPFYVPRDHKYDPTPNTAAAPRNPRRARFTCRRHDLGRSHVAPACAPAMVAVQFVALRLVNFVFDFEA